MFKQVKLLIDLQLNKPIKAPKNKLGNKCKPLHIILMILALFIV